MSVIGNEFASEGKAETHMVDKIGGERKGLAQGAGGR